MELILTQKCGKEKQASKLAEQTPAKAHGNAPADLPGPPPHNLNLMNGSIGLILSLPKFHLASSNGLTSTEEIRVRNCAFLVANATKYFSLATISQLVANGRLTILCHDNYTKNSFDFQPFKAACQLVTFFLPFRCFGSMKPISFIINLPQCFTATDSAKPHCYFFSGFL